MDASRGFFGKLRSLALTLEKEAKQLERALRGEDAGKCGHRFSRVLTAAAPRAPRAARVWRCERGAAGRPALTAPPRVPLPLRRELPGRGAAVLERRGGVLCEHNSAPPL